MKKFLTVLSCLLVFSGIVVLCYFFGYPKKEITVPVGEYYLEKIVEKTGEDDPIETEYTNGDLYLKVYKDNKIRSFSGDKGFVGSEYVYDFKLSGTNLTILYDGIKEYTGMFAEELIIIEFSEMVEVEGEEVEKIVHYYYQLKK